MNGMTEKDWAIFNEMAYEYTRNQPKGLKPLIPDILSIQKNTIVEKRSRTAT